MELRAQAEARTEPNPRPTTARKLAASPVANNHRFESAPDCYSRDSIKLRERTIYGDGHYIEQIYEKPDGAGNFDTVTTRSDNRTESGRRYETVTHYTVTGQDLTISNGYVQVGNPSSYLPQANKPWLLSLYDEKTTTVHGQSNYVKEFEFDPTTGLMSCERSWKNPGARSPGHRGLSGAGQQHEQSWVARHRDRQRRRPGESWHRGDLPRRQRRSRRGSLRHPPRVLALAAESDAPGELSELV